MRAIVSLAAASALIVSAAPPPQVPVPVLDANSPVRCRVMPRENVAATRAGRLQYRVRQSGAVPPPPPPPPPPPLPAPASAAPPAVSTSATIPSFVPAAPPYGAPGNTERYAGQPVAGIEDVAAKPVSTFSIDVDRGSYANVRRFLTKGQPVPPEAVRTEELVNYFRYAYPASATRDAPFSVAIDAAASPWNADTRLLRIGLVAGALSTAERPPANLVFLIDTSGSMSDPDKLPLLKAALRGLASRLRADDRVSIVAYAGSAGIVLEPTNRKRYVDAALDCLEAGGSTAGGAGIALAYATARAGLRPGAVNRIFLATDGDFNVGINDDKALEEVVRKNRDDGITLTTLGFGSGNYNEAMMERIADIGNGNYAYIDSAMEADKVLGDELSATLVTVAKDVKVQVEFNPAVVRQYRLIGYENRALAETDFANDAVDAGDVGAGHQVTALYEVALVGSTGWSGARRYSQNRAAPVATGSTGEAAFVKLRYKLPGGAVSREISRPVPASLLRRAPAARGDLAFVSAVAAYGQKLRGDPLLGQYSYAQVDALAGRQDDFWRQEFGKLVQLAGQQRPGGSAGQ